MNEFIQEMIQQANDAIAAGEIDTARDLLQEATDQDPENAVVWLLMAQVVDDENEKRICLSNVLQIDPENSQAQQLLDDLDKSEDTQADTGDFAPGIRRRQLNLIIIACIAFGVLSCGIVFTLAGSVNTGRANQEAIAKAYVAQQTQVKVDEAATIEKFVIDQTRQSKDATATAFATITPTITITPTSDLPPVFTEVPTATATPAALILDEPPPLPGSIVSWGGRDFFNNNFLELYLFNLAAGGRQEGFSSLNTDTVRFTTIHPSGQRVSYMRYALNISTWTLYSVNIDGSQSEGMALRWQGQIQVAEPEMPSYSSDGSQMTFVATSLDNQTKEVFLFNFTSDVALRLTTDDANYSFPVLSPDGKKVMVVRQDPATFGIDLVSIDVTNPTFEQLFVTSDGNAVIESSPSWSPDGTSIIYAAARQTAPTNNDILLRFSDGRAQPIPVVTTDADEILPHYSPDGQYVVYASNRADAYDIYIFELNTGRLWQLTATKLDEFPGGWSTN